ncbi:hypothetical protein [Pandoraea sputorum]|uniref:Uncharacterized protein n=1 Tax=Pandoraea sputorum TaxID=93222 RepID=A0A5E5BFP7_9BURK|nr:hypothetical protein [Pandoraea sputorum]VVE84168.1 hypothetical protein PSP31121_04632 [Pandoraea sputorum]
MNANGVTNPPSITPSNFPVESAPPPSGSLPGELTATHQAATTQSLDSGMWDDWARIRADYPAQTFLLHCWKSYVLAESVDDIDFGRHVKCYQDALESDQEPTLMTTALAAHIDELNVESRLRALILLLGLNGGPDGVTFDKNKLKTLAESRWIECFPDDEKDEVRALIQNFPRAV